MPKRKGEVPLWREMLKAISQEWEKKKSRPYRFGGQDLKLLRALVGWLSVPEVLALWTIYLRGGSFWGPKTGYLVSGMFQDRSVLLDHPEFKSLTERWEKDLEPDTEQRTFDSFLGGEDANTKATPHPTFPK